MRDQKDLLTASFLPLAVCSLRFRHLGHQPAPLTCQGLRNGKPTSRVTATTYTLTSNGRNRTISVRVSSTTTRVLVLSLRDMPSTLARVGCKHWSLDASESRAPGVNTGLSGNTPSATSCPVRSH